MRTWQHKKGLVETKDTLIELKNNLQGNNSKVDEAENQINDLGCKEAKNNKEAIRTTRRKKRIQKNDSML